ncbi:MAG: biotin--[acetyl-CoA-carboxylase] ligase [Bacteroidaceae bacterium]|nr:biotin--[acetyl-CoA-carboxylase] ligase [Bacteroidaceae bacterium]
MRYIELPETASTNTFVMERLRDYSAGCHVIYTLRQTAGRGMDRNKWESEVGRNIAFSIVFHPVGIAPVSQFLISMAVGVAVVEALQKMLPEEAGALRVKWPNDIYWNDKKLGGILIETSIKSSTIGTCVVGIGINVNQEVFLSDAPNPISLKQIAGREFCHTDVMQAVVGAFLAKMDAVAEASAAGEKQLEETAAKIRDDYHKLLYRNDGKLHWYEKDGSRFEAVITKVEADGRLHLCDADGQERRYWLKEVRMIIQ